MLCTGSVLESTGRKNCWLPADTSSPFQLCRRCHFHHITEVLDSLTDSYRQGQFNPGLEIYFDHHMFLQDLLHPAREQALLNLLSSLFHHNKIQFSLLVQKLNTFPTFSIFMTKRIQAHQPGPRCKMYRTFQSDTLCWNCWSCVAWCLKQRNTRVIQKFITGLVHYLPQLSFEMFCSIGPPTFVDLFVSLHLLGQDHSLRFMSAHMFHTFPLEDYKSFLLLFFLQPPMLPIFYEAKQNDYLPLPLQDKDVVEVFKKNIKAGIKRRTNMYKEDLVIYTWHPRRLFTWCMDIEDLKDFQREGSEIEEVIASIS